MQPNTTAIANSIVSLLQGLPTTLLSMCANQITASGSLQTVTPLGPNGMTGITNGIVLQIDAAAPENVVVSNVTSSTFQAVFTLNHSGTWTIGLGPNLYNYVHLGEIQDPTDIANYAAVTWKSRKLTRFDAGWKLNSEPVFQIESGFDLTGADTSKIEPAIMNVADTLAFLFAHRYTLNGVPGVYVTMIDQDDQSTFKIYPAGRIYRAALNYCKAIQQVNVQITP